MLRAAFQPYCRTCGKPLAKDTVKHTFGRDPRYLHSYEHSKDHAERPATVAEAQRLMNGRIIKHVWSAERAYVREVTEWDGESYQSRYGVFCTIGCAAAFGQLAAREHPELRTQMAFDAAQARGGR